MGIIDKIDEITAKSVTPEKFEKKWGYSVDKYVDDMMDFYNKLIAEPDAEVEPTESKVERLVALPAAAVEPAAATGPESVAAINLAGAATPGVAARATGTGRSPLAARAEKRREAMRKAAELAQRVAEALESTIARSTRVPRFGRGTNRSGGERVVIKKKNGIIVVEKIGKCFLGGPSKKIASVVIDPKKGEIVRGIGLVNLADLKGLESISGKKKLKKGLNGDPIGGGFGGGPK